MLKLFYKKDWLDLKVQLQFEKEKNIKVVSVLKSYENANKELNSKIVNYKKKIISLESIVRQSGIKIKKLNGSTGGLIKENNKLKQEIEDLKSDRYLRKQIPEGKRSNTQKIKVSKVPNTKVQNYMKKELSNE